MSDQELLDQRDRLREALKLFRMLVIEDGVPRYRVVSGAALNALIEEVVDPLLKVTQ